MQSKKAIGFKQKKISKPAKAAEKQSVGFAKKSDTKSQPKKKFIQQSESEEYSDKDQDYDE